MFSVCLCACLSVFQVPGVLQPALVHYMFSGTSGHLFRSTFSGEGLTLSFVTRVLYTVSERKVLALLNLERFGTTSYYWLSFTSIQVLKQLS